MFFFTVSVPLSGSCSSFMSVKASGLGFDPLAAGLFSQNMVISSAGLHKRFSCPQLFASIPARDDAS